MALNKGILIVLSSPSGGGKSTICRKLLQHRDDLVYSISVTTRPKRETEINRKDYHFVSVSTFKKYIKQCRLAEWALVHNNYYGTPKRFIRKMMNSGKNVILDIDVQGSMKLMKKYKNGLFIFILPPSMDELKRRLFKRRTDTEKIIQIRLDNAKKEMRYVKYYDYAVVNDDLKRSVNQINCIIEAENLKRRKIPKIK